MQIQHRFIEELTDLENKQVFCGQPIDRNNSILVIGTFNPNNGSCIKENDATWFYGRQRNLFWKYLPMSLLGESLHQNLDFSVLHWREFCVQHKIVIVDLLKGIDFDGQLEDFKDKRLDNKINDQLSNVDIFDFARAFKNISFEKVIYTRKGWNPSSDKDIPKLIQIKDSVNKILLANNIVADRSQIKYCPAPWSKRPTTQPQWHSAVNS